LVKVRVLGVPIGVVTTAVLLLMSGSVNPAGAVDEIVLTSEPSPEPLLTVPTAVTVMYAPAFSRGLSEMAPV
jgi:hypothetical protein